MSIAFDSSGSTLQNTSTTTIVVDITSAAVGSMCYMAWGQRTGSTQSTVSGMTGWTQILAPSHDGVATGTSSGIAVFSRLKQSGDSTFTLSYTVAGRSVAVWSSYTGVSSTTPNSTPNYLAHTASSASVATNSITNAFTNAWALTFFCIASSTATRTFTPDAALTERVDTGDTTTSDATSIEIADSNGVVTAAAHSYTATASAAESHGGGVLFYLNPFVSTNHGGFMDFFPI